MPQFASRLIEPALNFSRLNFISRLAIVQPSMIFQNKHLPEIEFEIELPGAMRRWEIAVFVRERQPQLNQFELVGVLT